MWFSGGDAVSAVGLGYKKIPLRHVWQGGGSRGGQRTGTFCASTAVPNTTAAIVPSILLTKMVPIGICCWGLRMDYGISQM